MAWPLQTVNAQHSTIESVVSMNDTPSKLNTKGFFGNIQLTISPSFDYYWERIGVAGPYFEKEFFGTGIGAGFHLGYAITEWLTFHAGFDALEHPKPTTYWTGASTFYTQVGCRVVLPVKETKFAPYATLEWGSRNISLMKSTKHGNIITIYDELDVWSNSIHWGFGVLFGYLDFGFKSIQTGYKDPYSVPFPTYRISLGFTGWFRLK